MTTAVLARPDALSPAGSLSDIGAVWVCVPTYNEASNVEPLSAAILRLADATDADLRVLFIDDNSPDGTGQIVRTIARADDRVRLLSRPQKAGLGPAYCHGFEVALANGADLIVQMDLRLLS